MLSQKMNAFEFLPSGIVLGNLLVVAITTPAFISSPFPSFNENLILMFLGFVQLGLGFLLFAYGQKFIDAIDSALISILEPIFNPVWVAIGYGEVPGALPLAGGLLIVFSLLMRSIYVAKKIKPI
jgi:drug/metabolite transporter (DMT)-like permease